MPCRLWKKTEQDLALADWKPEEANRYSDALEEALTALEKLMPEDKE